MHDANIGHYHGTPHHLETDDDSPPLKRRRRTTKKNETHIRTFSTTTGLG